MTPYDTLMMDKGLVWAPTCWVKILPTIESNIFWIKTLFRHNTLRTKMHLNQTTTRRDLCMPSESGGFREEFVTIVS
jgi:hypothetical protein